MTVSIVVTGARGFIGSHIYRALSARPGWRVTRVDRPSLTHPANNFAAAMLDDTGALADVLAELKPDHVIHAAGRVRAASPALYQDNVVTTVALADAIMKAAPEAILTAIGSAAEYGSAGGGVPIREDHPCVPVNGYGHAKLAAARYVDFAASQGLKRNWLRVFNPVAQTNPSTLVLGALVERAQHALSLRPQTKKIEMGYLGSVRDFVAMDDLVRLICRIIQRGDTGVVTNVCSGRGMTVRETARLVLQFAGIDLEIAEAPPPTDLGTNDSVVGDPTKFLSLAELEAPTPIETILAKIWETSGCTAEA